MPLDQPEEEKEMSFLDHLEELRWHLVRSVIAIMIGAVIAFIYDEILFDKIIFAPKDPNFITYRAFCKIGQIFGLGTNLCITDIPINIINMNMGGQFNMHMWASLVAGIILASPYIIYQIWSFLKPALYTHEKKTASGLLFYAALLFMLGVSFGYFVLSALSVNFLGNYQISESIANNINISSYISTITTVTLATGILFELPIFIYFLTKIGLVTPEFLRKYRRHALILNLVASAVITPPDIISQIIVALPLSLLYEIGILVSARGVKKLEKEQNTALVKK